MPLSTVFGESAAIDGIQRIRKTPLLGYSVAVLVVGIAALAREAMSPFLISGLPFLTFYPAIIIAVLFGGFGEGLLAITLSTIIAWFAFIPPYFSFHIDKLEAGSLFAFVVLALINAGLVAILNAVVERLASQEKNIRTLIEAAPNGIVVIDRAGTIMLVNASLEKLFGYSRAELIGRSVDSLVPTPLAEAHKAERENYFKKPAPRAMGAGRDLSGRRKDGTDVPVEIGLAPVRRNGKAAVLATVIDISERKHSQQQQQLLIGELEHRTTNLLAVVSSIAHQTLGEGFLTKEASNAFISRLDALARTYRVLARAAWEGAPLAEIFKQEFSAFFSEQINISGCDLVVSPSAAQHFALIVHELATNASKYGALSMPQGRVSVEGHVERANGKAVFSLCWTERGGPPVAAPERKGFGSLILLQAAKRFGLDVALHYEPGGLRYEVRVPFEKIEGASGVRPELTPLPAPSP